MTNLLIDNIPLLIVFILIITLLFLSAELGFYLGNKRHSKAGDNEEKQTGILAGASLALLSFMLAFTFSLANAIHNERKSLVVEETNALETGWLRTFLVESNIHTKNIQGLIEDYVELRISSSSWETKNELQSAIGQSRILLKNLWIETEKLVGNYPSSSYTVLLVRSINSIIETNVKRINVGHKRIPKIVSFNLLFIAIAAFMMMGYQSGLNGVRATVLRITLILLYASVMIVITDLDRPGDGLVKINQEILNDLLVIMVKNHE